MAQCNSRPGPWCHLTADTITDMKAKCKDYWTAIKGHKQLSVRGAHGCYMSPGCVKAADVYMSMANGDGNSFWLYKCPKLCDWLPEACIVYLPGYPEMSPTAMRQFWETVMHHDKGEISEKISKAQEAMNNAMDHENGCATTHYVKGKARKVASDSKACTIGFYGDLIEWPEDELSNEFLAGNCDALRAKFTALVGSKNECIAIATALDDDSGDCADVGQVDYGGAHEDDEDEYAEADEEINANLADTFDVDRKGLDTKDDCELATEPSYEQSFDLEHELSKIIGEAADLHVEQELVSAGQDAGIHRTSTIPIVNDEEQLHMSGVIVAAEDEAAAARCGDAYTRETKCVTRAYVYHVAQGKFEAVEPHKPNVIEHKPLPRYVQPILDFGAGMKRVHHAGLSRALEKQLTRAATPTPTLVNAKIKRTNAMNDSQGKAADHDEGDTRESKDGTTSSGFVSDNIVKRDMDAIQKHYETSRVSRNGLLMMEDEKKFLLQSLRQKHGAANKIPTNDDMKEFVKAGHKCERLCLTHGFEAVRNFYRQIYKLIGEIGEA